MKYDQHEQEYAVQCLYSLDDSIIGVQWLEFSCNEVKSAKIELQVMNCCNYKPIRTRYFHDTSSNHTDYHHHDQGDHGDHRDYPDHTRGGHGDHRDYKEHSDRRRIRFRFIETSLEKLNVSNCFLLNCFQRRREREFHADYVFLFTSFTYEAIVPIKTTIIMTRKHDSTVFRWTSCKTYYWQQKTTFLRPYFKTKHAIPSTLSVDVFSDGWLGRVCFESEITKIHRSMIMFRTKKK